MFIVIGKAPANVDQWCSLIHNVRQHFRGFIFVSVMLRGEASVSSVKEQEWVHLYFLVSRDAKKHYIRNYFDKSRMLWAEVFPSLFAADWQYIGSTRITDWQSTQSLKNKDIRSGLRGTILLRTKTFRCICLRSDIIWFQTLARSREFASRICRRKTRYRWPAVEILNCRLYSPHRFLILVKLPALKSRSWILQQYRTPFLWSDGSSYLYACSKW